MAKIQSASFVLVTILLIYSLYYNDAILFFSSLFLFPLIISIRWYHVNGLPKFRAKKISLQVKTIKKQKSDVINEILLGMSLFRRFNDYFKEKYSKDIEPSGVAKSISDVSLKNLKIILVSIAFSIVACIVLFLVTNSVISFLLLFLPLIIFTINRYELRSPTVQRKNGVEKELLFFCMFCDIMDNTQLSIYHIFEIVIHDDSGLFPWIRKEGIILQRDVVAFGDSSLHALKNLSKIHPSKLFSEFIAGYLTSQSAGGRDTGII